MTAGSEPWLTVDVRQLEALEAIDREGSFRAAAHALGYVQSAISEQLVQLERRLGARLVDRARGTGAVALTPAGRLVLEHAAALKRRYAAAAHDLVAMRRGTGARVRVGIAPGTMALLGRAVGALAEPVAPPSDGNALSLALDGRVDVAFCEAPVRDTRLASANLLSDPVVALVSVASPLARLRRPVTPSALADQPLVRLSSWIRQDEALRWMAAPAPARHATDRDATLRLLVGAGVACAVVPRLVAADDPGIRSLPLAGGPPARRLALAWRASHGGRPEIEAFVAAMLEVGAAARDA